MDTTILKCIMETRMTRRDDMGMWDSLIGEHSRSNGIFAIRAFIERHLFVVPLGRKETLAIALIIRVNQFFYLNTVEAIEPPIERDTVQCQSRAALRPWRTRIQLYPFTCLAHGLDVPDNTVLGPSSNDWFARQAKKLWKIGRASCRERV